MAVLFPLSDISLDNIINTNNRLDINLLSFYEKLAQYYYNTDNYLASVQIYYKYKDFDSIFNVLDKQRCSFVTKENFYIILKYFLEAPIKVKCKYIAATLGISYMFIISGKYSLFEKTREEICSYVLKSNIDITRKKKILGYLEFERIFYVYNDVNLMIGCYKKALELLGGNAFHSSQNMIDILSLSTPSCVYMFHSKIGKLKNSVFALNDIASSYYRLTNNNNMGIENVFGAEWLYLKGQMTDASLLTQNALCISEQYGSASMIISSYFIRARMGITIGQYNQVVESLQKMRNIADESDIAMYSVAVDFCEAYIYGILGHNEFIKKWIIKADITVDKVNIINYTNYFITHAICLINEQKYDECIEFIYGVINKKKFFTHLCIDIYAYMYLAIIYNIKNNHTSALENLRKSLELAMPDKLYMIFAEHYRFLEDILKELYYNDEFCDDITNIVDYGERINWWLKRFDDENFYGKNTSAPRKPIHV